jgi:hypothetical protein
MVHPRGAGMKRMMPAIEAGSVAGSDSSGRAMAEPPKASVAGVECGHGQLEV